MFPVANLYWPLFVIYLPPEFTLSHIFVHDQISMNLSVQSILNLKKCMEQIQKFKFAEVISLPP